MQSPPRITAMIHVDGDTYIDATVNENVDDTHYVTLDFGEGGIDGTYAHVFVTDLNTMGRLLSQVALAYENLRQRTNGPTPRPTPDDDDDRCPDCGEPWRLIATGAVDHAIPKCEGNVKATGPVGVYGTGAE